MGDLGMFTKEGCLKIVGRCKEQIVLKNTKKTNAAQIDLEVEKSGNVLEIATISIR